MKSSKPLKNTRQVDKWKTDNAGLRKLQDNIQNECFSLTASASSTSTLITHQLFRSHNSSKNNNNKNNRNTPAYSSGLGWVPHLHISISAYLPFTVTPSVPTSTPNVTKTSTVSKQRPSAKILRPSFLRSQNPVSTLTTSSEAHQFIGTSTKKVVNIVLSPPADRGIPMTIWIRSLELPPSLTDDQDSPLGLPKLSLRTCPSLIRWLGAPDLQPNRKASPPEETTGPPQFPH